MSPLLYEFGGKVYPDYLKRGNACQFIEPIAKQFCKGIGLDVGCGQWPLKGALPIDKIRGDDVMALPEGQWSYIFSSHCLEHVVNPVKALEHWRSRIRPGGVLFLYSPHPDMIYWRPEHCRKHRHLFWPDDLAEMVRALGFVDVIHSERDLCWSFCVVGWLPE